MKSLFVLLCLLGEILARTWFDGLNYNPKQKDGSCPTVDTVRSDLSAMAPYTDTIKIFSVKDCNQGEPVLRAVEGTSWKVVLGMWVGPDDSAFNADVQELTRLNSVFDLKKYVKYVVVGSESLYRKDQTEDQLIAKINQARQLLNSLGLSSIPVTTADVYLNYSARLASAVDFVMMNAFTYWEGVPIEAAANTMFEHINAVKAISGGKRVVVGETGWPTRGSNFGAAVPSLANSARYMREFICRAHAEQIEYYWYAAIDTPWNTTPTNTVEAHFGILDADHNPKYPGDNWFACDNSSTSTTSSSSTSTSTSTNSSTSTSSSTSSSTSNSTGTSTATSTTTSSQNNGNAEGNVIIITITVTETEIITETAAYSRQPSSSTTTTTTTTKTTTTTTASTATTATTSTTSSSPTYTPLIMCSCWAVSPLST